jgi:hypothetical protein
MLTKTTATLLPCNEESAQTLGITLEQVLKAEEKGKYVDYHNSNTGVLYRIYLVNVHDKPDISLFDVNAVGKSHVEMVKWRYFNTVDLFNNQDRFLPDTDVKIYATTCTRLKMVYNTPLK